jgi:hypothetical protein
MIMPAAAHFMIGNTARAYGHQASVILELRVILKVFGPGESLCVSLGASPEEVSFRRFNYYLVKGLPNRVGILLQPFEVGG